MKWRHKDGDIEDNNYVPYNYDKESQIIRDKAIQTIDKKTTPDQIGLYVDKMVQVDMARSFWSHIDDFVSAVRRILDF